jgi:ribosomal-protein-alanine N-acetyltransferase
MPRKLRSARTERLLDRPTSKRRAEFLAAVTRSKKLHAGWVMPPRTAEAFDAYLRRTRRKNRLDYWVLAESGELAGVIHLGEIVRGIFRSGYLGYYAFVPHAGRGTMGRALTAVLEEVFTVHRLHRVEANIQPGNEASRNLARRLGFRLEGFSPRYLKIAGRWRDHERWAITVEDWRARRKRAK